MNLFEKPEDPTSDKAHFDFFIFMFIRGSMYMSIIFFEIFVLIKLTFMNGINRQKSCFRLKSYCSRLFDPRLNVKI